MKKLFKRKKEIPTGQTIKVDVYEIWMVRWRSRSGLYHSDTKDTAEAFTNEQDARKFEKALKDAFKLIRHTSGTNITVEKM